MGQGACILGLSGPVLRPDEAAFFARARPWGFILFARNVENPAQLRQLTADLRASVGRAAPVMVDQEGGRVQRLGPPHWRGWMPPLEEAHTPDAARRFYLRARLIADELRAVGIDVNCAPCADIARIDTHPVLRNRCLGQDVETVVNNSSAVARGLLDGGVVPVLKHIPGHGRARLDSHKTLPRVNAPAADLRAEDFAVFKALSGLPLGMSAHVVYEAFDGTDPATTSAIMARLIRDEIGFGGLLMSDDISMNALSGDVAMRSRAALAAGLDLVLHCNGDLAQMQAVAEAAGPLSAAAQARATRALAARCAPKSPDFIDIAAVRAEFEGQLNGRVHE